jgi:deoxyribodipyrimidine photo-lyase
MRTALVWYRRDLRVHDHPALVCAAREYERVIPVFVLDDALLHGRFASTARTEFMLGCVRALRETLRSLGSDLVVRRGRPELALAELVRDTHAEALLFSSDVAPYARARDARVTEALQATGVSVRPCAGTYIVNVGRPRTGGGDPYRVFSPFYRAWQQLDRRVVHRAPRTLPPLPNRLRVGRLPHSAVELGVRGDAVAEPVVAPGEAAARAAVSRWLAHPIERYADRQDGIARRGTSCLSPYLRWGCLSPLELEQRARGKGGAGAAAWVRQLCWREFYAHVLLMWPGNARHEFQERRRGLQWDDPSHDLDAWQAGQTGYPIVDAGMRQLARSGWMHNRARLIVGSFLTKDLHLDWRHGERWFERLLLDGEPAQNNGNWQWIASVGADPAPVARRLYNPTLQGRRFDPDGAYIREHVHELAAVPDHRLHEPWTMTAAEQRAAGCRIGRDYPAPIVDHQHERQRALARYAATRA